ncbi:MAG: 4Fe-4S binding protein [bacterium]|nr:4Fe-4S binding protein [bacterium]
MERKKFFTDGLKGIGKDLWKGPVGEIVGHRLQNLANLLAPEGLDHAIANRKDQGDFASDASAYRIPDEFARPPGALPDPAAFDRACTRCGDCVIACPYGVIFTLGGASGPLLDPNSVACQLCPDMPCISACDDDALRPLPANSLPKFGQAEVISGACLNATPDKKAAGDAARSSSPRKKSGGRKKTCRECAKACPVPEVISYGRGKEKLPRFADHCTGCGQCIPACPAETAAIRIAMNDEG